MKISAWPAKRGDCLLLEYGTGADGGRILVDCGFKTSYTESIRGRLAGLEGSEELRLLVVTHVDLDHINGVLEMFEDSSRPVTFADVWFNTFEHLEGKRLVSPPVEDFGGPEGEELSVQLIEQAQPWNKAFDGRPVTTATPMDPIDPNLGITVLSPTTDQLTGLVDRWKQECKDAGITAGFDAVEPTDSPFEVFGAPSVGEVHDLAAESFDEEGSPSNQSTIALLVEHNGQRALLTGDAHTPQLVDAVRPLAQAAGGKLPLDLMQVPHHGSKGNLSKELLDLVDCRRYIVSTNGSNHGHPHDETIARVLVFGGAHKKQLIFNYRDRARRWRSGTLQDETNFNYEITTPASTADDGAVTVDLSAM